MLDYQWENPSNIILSSELESVQDSDQNATIFYPFAPQNFAEQPTGFIPPETHFAGAFQHQHAQNTPTTHFYDSRPYGGACDSPYHSPFVSTGFMLPKSESAMGTAGGSDFGAGASRIGLNLGGRTYFASSEDDFVNRLYRRKILDSGPANSPRCQAEGCNSDLTQAKHYHRRHKVCEFHSKAATVAAAGMTQRFCQQCSRFHLLSEFDNGKRSCRKRLADHNRRRRKSQQSNQENKSKMENNATNSSSENIARSPPDSEPHSSSVTVAISPPRISLDCFGHRSYKGGVASSTASTTSLYY